MEWFMSSTATAVRTQPGIEVWEITIEGAVWIPVLDTRGNEKQVKVGPRKGARLRIKTADREASQDRVLYEGSDPFSNGVLVRIDGEYGERRTTETDLEGGAYTDEVLAFVMEKTGPAFEAAVRSMEERGVRALKNYALAHDGTVSQLKFVQEEIDEKYKIEAVMPSTQEIIDAEENGDRE